MDKILIKVKIPTNVHTNNKQKQKEVIADALQPYMVKFKQLATVTEKIRNSKISKTKLLKNSRWL